MCYPGVVVFLVLVHTAMKMVAVRFDCWIVILQLRQLQQRLLKDSQEMVVVVQDLLSHS